ncbi:hypothetical protein PC129_g20315 [Phytophthora cactorum]|uniref:Uncharacterized protein n=1 Tax=Phytophthora cactorum TaxID=29920 RepID=A0A8T1H9R8_9STRA|nr:hypothetical protein Pcac1_g11782 [Phytophthora cactorum]KAG2880353.1 hypothetical protein PC114_g22118 [Phytophthora cactorum]KAG2921102.1 hypothetical protein PC117_g16330 [Phytophthora cactorum]KAG2994467.1 hypothetical protein PC119_g18254 [Phytophthora cactorum]KAG3130633.1 hypothetical protein C6341_g23672 [Phytophthora cactorum]
MTLDVVSNIGHGPKALLESWRRFSTSFQGVEIELEDVKSDGENSLVATITSNFTFTKRMLQKKFPHQRGGRSSLAKKLLHQDIVVPGTVQFIWDRTGGRITSVLTRSNMLTPMLDLVGNMGDLVRVLEYSHVLG